MCQEVPKQGPVRCRLAGGRNVRLSRRAGRLLRDRRRPCPAGTGKTYAVQAAMETLARDSSSSGVRVTACG